MEAKEEVELLQWLIVRSDNRRSSYGNRAALILSADAIILAAVVFLLDRSISQPGSLPRMLVLIPAFAALGFMFVSLVFALCATTSLGRNSRSATRFKGPPRHFLNPGETFADLKSYEEFRETLQETTFETFVERGSAELWVALRLQHIRYKMLKTSMISILCAFTSLLIALVVAFLH
jgi:hypothetical protein